MTDWPAIITAATGLLTVLGGGFAWLWREVKAIKSQQQECQKREAKLIMVIELLWQAASKSKAAAPVLARCKEHLDKLKEDKGND